MYRAADTVAVDRILCYLYETRFRSLQLGGGDDFIIASDASFADNTLDRQSYQGYAIKLFGGMVGWKAGKQDTVTTSTTEAELLSLAYAVKEGMSMWRLTKELNIRLDQSAIRVQCDNQQTIRLVTAEVATLQTKLRHVDIHCHWLRQEFDQGKITVEYTPTKDMIADGLTKALTADNHTAFCQQMGLVNVSRQIQQRRLREIDLEDLEAFEDLMIGGETNYGHMDG
ncbi:hypothetical protein PG991_009249 [Apiospora marii]|uniref:Polyprotein n=1 Tax=Apiospora marii TaxID=335849 RepID=A0ABR1RLE6_9PEZI